MKPDRTHDQQPAPRLLWALRSFLDYRVPVFLELDRLSGGRLQVVFPQGNSPERARERLKSALGDRAVELTGERTLGTRVPSNQFANTSWMVTMQPGLARFISASKPDVMIGDGFGQWTMPLIRRRAMSGTPLVICYERTTFTERGAQWLRRVYRRHVARWMDAACCNGELGFDYLRSLGIPAHRITRGFLVPDPQIRQRFEQLSCDQVVAARVELGLQSPLFLMVGRLIDRKGVMETVKAWHRFRDATGGAGGLAIAGDGERRGDLEAYMDSHDLRNVRVLGSVDYDRIERLYAASDYLLMPTLEDNWSLVVLEAMSCGKPILCSRFNGCWPEMIDEDRNGWVFDPLNADDFHRVLMRAVESSDRLEEMRNRSRDIVSAYTPTSSARSIHAACQIALQRPRRRRPALAAGRDGR